MISANLRKKIQAYVGILDILLVPCPFFNNLFVQFLWVHGFQNLGSQMDDHLLRWDQMLLLVLHFLC